MRFRNAFAHQARPACSCGARPNRKIKPHRGSCLHAGRGTRSGAGDEGGATLQSADPAPGATRLARSAPRRVYLPVGRPISAWRARRGALGRRSTPEAPNV